MQASNNFTLWHQARDFHLADPTNNTPNAECAICYTTLRILRPANAPVEDDSDEASVFPCGHMICGACWVSFTRNYQSRVESYDGSAAPPQYRCPYCKFNLKYINACHALAHKAPEHAFLDIHVPKTIPEGAKGLGGCTGFSLWTKWRIRTITRYLDAIAPDANGRYDFSPVRDALSNMSAPDAHGRLVPFWRVMTHPKQLELALWTLTSIYMKFKAGEEGWHACAERCAEKFMEEQEKDDEDMYLGVADMFREEDGGGFPLVIRRRRGESSFVTSRSRLLRS
ncbi:hypothetical protein OQA88_10690 [Cercophora sp. LCS_1]